jgi:hypothetical protein
MQSFALRWFHGWINQVTSEQPADPNQFSPRYDTRVSVCHQHISSCFFLSLVGWRSDKKDDGKERSETQTSGTGQVVEFEEICREFDWLYVRQPTWRSQIAILVWMTWHHSCLASISSKTGAARRIALRDGWMIQYYGKILMKLTWDSQIIVKPVYY